MADADEGLQIKFRIQRLFRVYRSLTSPKATIARLQQGHRASPIQPLFCHFSLIPPRSSNFLQWLEIFKKAQEGDAHLQAVLARYAKMIDHRRGKEEFHYILRQEAVSPILPPATFPPVHLFSTRRGLTNKSYVLCLAALAGSPA